MSNDSQNWAEDHATADPGSETLAQEQLPICLAFRDEHGSDHKEYTEGS